MYNSTVCFYSYNNEGERIYMGKIIKQHKKAIIYFLGLLLFVPWIFTLNLGNFDDTFTLRILQHSIPQIIRLDALDVHPPLYYIILKLFFNVTFISHASPFIQIIAGRLFSALIFLITLFVMRVVLEKLLNKHVPFTLTLSVCLLPTILWYSTDIRMYSLSALFIAYELNSIINFNRNHQTKDIILATLFAALGAWTHYFTAIIAGLMLFYSFIMNKKGRISYLISGICFFILFTPWLKVSMNQMASVNHSYWIKNQLAEYLNVFCYSRLSGILGNKLACYFSLLFIGCLFYTAFKTLKTFNQEFRKYYMMVSVILFGTIILGFILSILIRPIFQARYVYGISMIYFVMNLPLIQKLLTTYSNSIIKWGFLGMVSIGVLFNLALGAVNSVKNIKIIQNVSKLEKSPVTQVKCDHELKPVTLMNSFLVQNKTFTTKHYDELSDACQSKMLFKNIYPNIKDK